MVVEALSPSLQGFATRDLGPMTETTRPSPRDWEVLAALQEFGEPKPISRYWAIFNTVSLDASEISPGSSILLSRAVYIPNIREGEPDRNSLHVCVKDSNGKRLRLPDLDLPVVVDGKKIVNWEDPRVGPNDRTLGFTAVLREDGKYSPHPAIVDVAVADGQLRVVGDPRIFKNITGKNVIPLEDGLIYRPEEETHKLHYLDPQGELLRTVDFSNFRDIPWLSKKMGAVAKPIVSRHLDLEDGEKLLLIHGVRGGKGIDGRIKNDIYAIGLAILDKDWHVLAVDTQPLLKRKYFLNNLHPSRDLNPKKEVIYLCDFTEREDGLVLPTTVGERITVIEHSPYAVLKARIANMRLPKAAFNLAA